jgi:TRAP-type C4-dicarboxylate transport system permease small subunit
MVSLFERLDRAVEKLASVILFTSLIAMISLTLLSIVLRWFNHSLLWIEPFVRHLVFMTAFTGGIVATGSKNHICIDLMGRILDTLELAQLKNWVNRLIYAFCIGALIWLTYAGYMLVETELEIGQEKFLGIHSSVLAATIPVGLALIAFRFLFLLIQSFTLPASSSEASK